MAEIKSTRGKEYTDRLIALQAQTRWMTFLDVQAPYRWNLRRLNSGFTLDIGCGLGRNLAHIRGNGVGIDHNATSVEVARSLGLLAFLPEEFSSSRFNQLSSFDSILLAHVVEHMKQSEAAALVQQYLPLLKSGGKIIFITPQEAGFRSDPSHIEFARFEELEEIFRMIGVRKLKSYSFPFPRWVGRIFKYNEFVSVGVKN